MPGPMTRASGALTPFFLNGPPRRGWVHSVFARVVNLAFEDGSGQRLLTITGLELPELPDSLRIAADGLAHLQSLPPKAPVLWQRGRLEAPGLAILWEERACAMSPWQPPPMTAERARRFLALYGQLTHPGGFDHLTETRRIWAMRGLRDFAGMLLGQIAHPDSWPIGLGKGTTPAGDDALVGILAMLGGDASRLTDPLDPLIDNTTDISARYLRCAREGYFSAPVRRAVEDMTLSALNDLAQVGATSGMDMLTGMAVACERYIQEENTMQIKQEIASRKLIAIVRGLPAEQLSGLADALLAGGISLIEVTFNQANPDSWQTTADGIRMLAEKYAGRIIPGAGTVMTQEQLTLAYEAGAKYIISPNTDEAIIRRTKELGLISMPGAFSPTEIAQAHNAGADYVKVFPVGNLGPAYIKAVKAPLSHIEMMAVGGVNEKNAADFIKAGAAGLGVGGNLVNKEWIANGEWDKITTLAAEFVKAVQ